MPHTYVIFMYFPFDSKAEIPRQLKLEPLSITYNYVLCLYTEKQFEQEKLERSIPEYLEGTVCTLFLRNKQQ